MTQLNYKEAIGTWNQGENDNNWVVVDKEGNVLFELKAKFNEQSVMQAIHMARDAEERAFKVGFESGRALQKKLDEKFVKQAEEANKVLSKENERISEILEKHINS